MTLWVLGYPQQAIRELEETLAEIEHVQHPAYRATALQLCAYVYRALQDVASVQRLADQVAEIGARFDIAFAVHNARVFLGWIKGEQGYPLDGIELLHHSIQFFRRMEQITGHTCRLAIITELYLQVGDLAAAETTIDEALTLSDTKEERQWDPELFRLQGHIYQAQGAPAGVVERSYRQALTIARKQQARSFELRAAMSLARLWQAQGKGAEANALLADIYGWFTEGFDTADLIEAKALLEALK
jgi:tetratricopeptide (TPR) repeat protein